MSKKLFSEPTVFDFRSKRVRMNGKCIDKFTIGYVVGCIDHWKGLYLTDVLSYDGCKDMLLDLLKEYNFSNVVYYE